MSSSSSSAKTETYVATKATVEAIVTPRIVTQSEQVARYFIEDLLEFIEEANIDLVRELQTPPEDYENSGGLDSAVVVEMLFDDIAHMLRDTLITAVHLLLSEQQTDPNTGAYPLRYHARYTITKPVGATKKEEEGKAWGGHLAPPKEAWVNARFALLIDWNPSANERRRQVRRPQYCFDWVPEHSRFDETNLIRYREGGMTADGAAKLTVQSSLVSRVDITYILRAIENESFRDYQRLANAIIRCMQATDPFLIKSPDFDPGTVWKISLPVFGLRLRTQETILFLRQRKYRRASYEDLTKIQHEKDAEFIIIIDILDIPSAPLPITSRTVWFRCSSLKEMIKTREDELLGWLGRFITTQVDVKLLLPYRTHGAATDLFFGREEELARLTGGKIRGGIIIGAHRSGKTSLLHRLGERLKKRGHIVVGPIIFTGEEFQSFFESTLLLLSLDCREGMTSESWASTLRAYNKKQGKSPVFLLDEVDGLLAVDTKERLTLGRQMRALQSEGLCEFYLAGHKMLRQAITLEEGPLRNFAEEITLTGLTQAASIRLIQEPMEKIGFSVNNKQAERIFKGTAGVAVLIQEFCFHLLCGLFHQDSNPEIEDAAIETVELSPDYLNVVFEHYVYGQGWIEMSVMLITAIHKEVTRQDILREFNEHRVVVRRNLLDAALGFLVNFGTLQEFIPNHYTIVSTYLHDAIMTRDPHSLLDDKIEEGKKESNHD